MDRDLALAYAIAEEERRHEENGRSGDGNNGSSGGGPRQKRIPRGSRTGPGLQYPGATSPTSPAKQPKAPPSPRPIRGQLVSVHLARLPDGKNFGITITQSPLEGVRVLNLAHKHEVLEVNDRIVEVNGIAVTGLSVREVAECVRKRKQDRILSLVVEKPRKWSIGRFFMRSEQRQEESLQRHVFGGSYPRTLHLTVIGAIGLPSLYPSAQYPNSYVEVTNRSTSTSFRTTVHKHACMRMPYDKRPFVHQSICHCFLNFSASFPFFLWISQKKNHQSFCLFVCSSNDVRRRRWSVTMRFQCGKSSSK